MRMTITGDMWKTAALILAGASVAAAQSNGLAAYLTSVCMPMNEKGSPDMNIPCNAVAAIQSQCMYGSSYYEQFMNGTNSSPNNNDQKRDPQSPQIDNNNKEGDDARRYRPPMQSDADQRVCICESQFWDQLKGCLACYRAHAPDAAIQADVPASQLSTASSSYCAASATVSAGLADTLMSLVGNLSRTDSATTQTGTSTVNFRDPIGNKTDVSYYYTPSVTGTAAWLISRPTGNASLSGYSSTNIQNGQIRPTQSGNAAATQSASRTAGVGNEGSRSASSACRFNIMGAVAVFALMCLTAWL